MYMDVQNGAYISARGHARKDVGTRSHAHIHTRGVDVFVGIFACMYVYLSACMFECACIHIRTHVRMHASLLSGKASFPLTTQKLFSTCVGAAGETDLRAHRSRQIVARVLVIAGYMECDFVAMVCSGRTVNTQ